MSEEILDGVEPRKNAQVLADWEAAIAESFRIAEETGQYPNVGEDFVWAIRMLRQYFDIAERREADIREAFEAGLMCAGGRRLINNKWVLTTPDKAWSFDDWLSQRKRGE